MKVANLVFLCGIPLLWFPDDDPLWMETCANIQRQITIQISKTKSCAFCCLSVALCLP
jgi:hypothetical protein